MKKNKSSDKISREVHKYLPIIPAGPIYEVWETIFVLALIYNLLVIPSLMAFHVVGSPDGWWIANRVVDCVFLVQMFLSCVTSYHVKLAHIPHPVWEASVKNIALKYLRHRFIYDLLYWINFAYDIARVTDGFHAQASKDVRLKLARLLRFFAIFKNYAHFDVMDGFWRKTIDYFQVPRLAATVADGLMGLLLAAHYMACVWGLAGLISTQQVPGSTSWLVTYENNYPAYAPISADPMAFYIVCVYWAVVTLTTVGYGDIVAANMGEWLVCAVLILAATAAWARFFAVISAVVLPEEAAMLLPIRMDAINQLAAEHQEITHHLKANMIHLLRKHVEDSAQSNFEKALSWMSPSLRSQLILEVYRPRILTLSYFGSCNSTLLWLLTGALELSSHEPSEKIVPLRLLPFVSEQPLEEEQQQEKIHSMDSFSATSGNVIQKLGKLPPSMAVPVALPLTFLQSGKALLDNSSVFTRWHEDFILAECRLQDQGIATAMSVSTAMTLTRDALMSALSQSGDLVTTRAVHVHAGRLAMHRLIRVAAARMKSRKRGLAGSSSSPASSASEREGLQDSGSSKFSDILREILNELRTSTGPSDPLQPAAGLGKGGSRDNVSEQLALLSRRMEQMDAKLEMLLEAIRTNTTSDGPTIGL